MTDTPITRLLCILSFPSIKTGREDSRNLVLPLQEASGICLDVHNDRQIQAHGLFNDPFEFPRFLNPKPCTTANLGISCKIGVEEISPEVRVVLHQLFNLNHAKLMVIQYDDNHWKLVFHSCHKIGHCL